MKHAASFAHHRTPLRRGRADAQADEAEAGDSQDGPGDRQRGLHNDGGHAVGQDVLEDDALVAGADGAGRLDVLLVLDGQNGGADDPGKGRDVGDADGQHHIRDAGAHGGHQGDGQQDAGDRQEDVHDTHDDIVYPAAAVTGDGPQQTAHHCGNGDGGKGHRQGDPGAVDDPGQDVAAHLVGAQPVLDGGAGASGMRSAESPASRSQKTHRQRRRRR